MASLQNLVFFNQFIIERNRILCIKIARRRRKDLNNIRSLYEKQILLMQECIKYFPLADIFELFSTTIRVDKRIWMERRSYEFCKEIVLCAYTDEDWIESFRMGRKSFDELCLLLGPALQPKPLLLKSREPLSVAKQVAVALYKLASCAEYRVVGNIFGIHKSTVKKSLFRVVNAINAGMMKNYIRMPSLQEANEISKRFEKVSRIPQIMWCIDGTHIPILAPSYGYRYYVNRKGWTSLVLQAVVDDRSRFRNICIRHPGSTHDAAFFKDSGLYKNAKNIIPHETRSINGMEIPYFIIGDPAYPLLPWLIKGYPGAVSLEKESFNVHLNSARVAVEIAFGRLKGRWRILLKRVDISYEFVPQIVSACCILQNYLELKKETFVPNRLNEVREAEVIFRQPESITNRERDDISASPIRTELTNYLCNNFPLRTRIIF